MKSLSIIFILFLSFNGNTQDTSKLKQIVTQTFFDSTGNPTGMNVIKIYEKRSVVISLTSLSSPVKYNHEVKNAILKMEPSLDSIQSFDTIKSKLHKTLKNLIAYNEKILDEYNKNLENIKDIFTDTSSRISKIEKVNLDIIRTKNKNFTEIIVSHIIWAKRKIIKLQTLQSYFLQSKLKHPPKKRAFFILT